MYSLRLFIDMVLALDVKQHMFGLMCIFLQWQNVRLGSYKKTYIYTHAVRQISSILTILGALDKFMHTQHTAMQTLPRSLISKVVYS